MQTTTSDVAEAKQQREGAVATPQSASATPLNSTEKGKKEPYRVLALPGGGLDTVMHLGVVHALLVSRAFEPDMVTGISAGAINAAALAEVLQAGAELTDTTEREAAQVARFLEMLEAFRNAPATVLRGMLPDPYETTMRQALKSVELPRHFGEERKEREESVSTRTGLIKLLNGIFRVRVRLKTITRLVRVALGWSAAAELPRWYQQAWAKLRLLGELWWLIAVNIFTLSAPVGRVVGVLLLSLVREVMPGDPARKDHGVDAAAIILNRGALKRALIHACCCLLGFGFLASALLWLPGLLVAGCIWIATKFQTRSPIERFLDHYRLLSDLGDSYVLKEALVQLFDPDYYGEFQFDEALHLGLDRKRADPQKKATGLSKKTLKSYQTAKRSIRVVPLAANLATGRMEAIPETAPVVDALMAACAVVPFYKAQPIPRETDGRGERRIYIDGISVANHPITETLAHLSLEHEIADHFETKYSEVRIYSVSLLPIEKEELPGRTDSYTNLVDVGLRALQLQRFQDALLEKHLVDTYNDALPRGASSFTVLSDSSEPKQFFRTHLVHVTPEEPHELNTRVPAAGSAEDRRALMESAAADGCRAMIQKLLESEHDGELHIAADKLSKMRDGAVDKNGHPFSGSDGGHRYVACSALVKKARLKPLAGSKRDGTGGPGVWEICRHCAIRGAKREDIKLRQHVQMPPTAPEPELTKKTKTAGSKATPSDITNAGDAKETTTEGGKQASTDPSVIFLFSGGVFRGVFQVGFATAVSELFIEPNVVAGSSVGTIVGALVGRVFRKEQVPTGKSDAEARALELDARRAQLQRLAATFLCIDQFVMTDRFADFIRHLSIRAAGADFSLHDADILFRRFDVGGVGNFTSRLRRVAAGLERILYVSPFELRTLVETARNRDYPNLWAQCKRHVKEVVERYGVGLELLGPEPLQLLIDSFIFDGKRRPEATFGYFRKNDSDFHFLGTVTNLTKGRLEILSQEKGARLTDGLLASSAFPAVFRPRWSWEIYSQPQEVAQYCDGGVMDNLPLDAVVEFLASGDPPRFPRRPDVPHLILTASLEPEPADWSSAQPAELEERSKSWRTLKKRAAELRYNGKIDKFQSAQHWIRRIVEQRAQEEGAAFDRHGPKLPLNLDVLVVKPKWLCGTFGFHPMLGFRRKAQAASIAHGCASTMQAVYAHFFPQTRTYEMEDATKRDETLRAWAKQRRIAYDTLLDKRNADLSSEQQARGVCWFRRKGAEGIEPLCPFHRAVVLATASGEEQVQRENLAGELHEIYLACGRESTDKPQR
jgi:predicted acylesterase/phospholipase RssA